MKTSTAQNSWGEEADEIAAQIVAKKIRKTARLRDVAEQSSFDFFIGGSLLAATFRIAALLAFGFFYFRSDAFSSLGVWPVFAIGGFVEAQRANRRLDALLELQKLEGEEANANKPQHPTA